MKAGFWKSMTLWGFFNTDHQEFHPQNGWNQFRKFFMNLFLSPYPLKKVSFSARVFLWQLIHRVESMVCGYSFMICKKQEGRPLTFLDASSHLYERVCPSVRPSIHPSVHRSHTSWNPAKVPFSTKITGNTSENASYAVYTALFFLCSFLEMPSSK